MWLTLLPLALAQQDFAPCQAYVFATLPTAGAIDVPVDMWPLAFVDAGDCAPPESYLVALLEDSEAGQPVIFDEEIVVTQPFTFLPLDLPEELSPVTDYILRISPRDGGGQMVEVPFSTGERHTTEVDLGAPTLSVGAATRASASSGYRLTYSAVVTGEQDFERLSATFLRDEDGEIVGAAPLSEAFNASVNASWAVADKPKELCLSATQVLANGQESPASELVCEDVQRASGGCAAAGQRGGLALTLLGLGLLLGRRRR